MDSTDAWASAKVRELLRDAVAWLLLLHDLGLASSP